MCCPAAVFPVFFCLSSSVCFSTSHLGHSSPCTHLLRHQAMYRETATNNQPLPAMYAGRRWDAPSDPVDNTIYLNPRVDDSFFGAPSVDSVDFEAMRNDLPDVPRKDVTFIIRDPKTRCVITLRDGVLGLHPQERQQSGNSHYSPRADHWHCVEDNDMWLGFRNAVSGTYLGHDSNAKKWRFRAEGKKHGGCQHFCVRQDPSGGHVLLVMNWTQFRAMKAGGVEGRELVVGAQGDRGTAWEFTRVNSDI
ncbi:hypothetical protein BJX99DRAFT_221922 [Aspergillus californicus]